MPNNLLPFFLISAFVALIDILSLLFKKKHWRYTLAVFVQVIAIGMTVFCLTPELKPWWAVGPAAGLLLTLPRLILPPVRGAAAWYAALLNGVFAGLLFALVRHSLTRIAVFFT